MTLPIYMKNRIASSFVGNLQDLEANVVFTLAHKFAPPSSGADNDSMMEDITTAQKTIKKRLPLTPIQAADVVDVSLQLQDYRNRKASLTSSPERPPNKKARIIISRPRKNKPAGSSSCSLPTADDPIDESFLTKLYSKHDEGKINPAHIIIRREVLEVRRTVSGRILFQCACCKHLPRGKRAKLSTLAPQSVGNLYRAMVRFMMNHVPLCGQIPQDIKDLSPKASRVVNERGTKKYWVKSAMRKGLRDGEDGKSIVYCHPIGD